MPNGVEHVCHQTDVLHAQGCASHGPFAYAWGVFQSDFSHLPSAGVHKEGYTRAASAGCVYKVQVWTKRCAQGCVYEVRTATPIHLCSK
jgi:hypothetical protein